MTTSSEEIIQRWGKANLRRWPIEKLLDAHVPLPSARFLADVGLPRKLEWGLRFDLPDETLVATSPELTGQIQIGAFGEPPGEERIYIDVSGSGSVHWSGRPDLFMNTDVERLGRSLTEYQRWLDAIKNVPLGRRQALLDEFRSALWNADPVALQHVSNFWAPVIEDAELHV